MKEVNYDELNRIRELSGTLQESWQEKMQGRPMPFPDAVIADDHPASVSNPFSGESILLDPQEIAVYDVIMGANLTKNWDLVRKGSDWFRKHNPEAYMVLID
jgi:hypothetical protein